MYFTVATLRLAFSSTVALLYNRLLRCVCGLFTATIDDSHCQHQAFFFPITSLVCRIKAFFFPITLSFFLPHTSRSLPSITIIIYLNFSCILPNDPTPKNGRTVYPKKEKMEEPSGNNKNQNTSIYVG